MPLTISQFGQRIKQKYPAYQDMSDDELGQKMLAKHPQYRDMVESPSIAERASGVAEKVGGFIIPRASAAAKQIGAGLAGRQTDEAQRGIQQSQDLSRRLIERAKQETDPKEKELLLRTASEASQRIGDVAGELERGTEQAMGLEPGETPTSPIRQGVGVAGELGSMFLPLTKEARGLAAAAKLAGPAARIGEAGLSAGAQGFLRGITTPEGGIKEVAKETGKQAATSAALGAAIQTGIEGATYLSQLLRGVTGEAKEKAISLYRDTLKENKTALKAVKRQGGVDKMVKRANALKLPKTKNGMERELEKYGPVFNKKVNAALEANKAAAGKNVDMATLIKDAQDDVSFLNRPETRAEYDQAQRYLDDAMNTYGKQKASVVSVNRLRQSIDGLVGDIPFGEARGKKAAMKAFAGSLRNTVKTAVPETKPYFMKYSLMSDLLDAMMKEPKFGIVEMTGALGVGAPAALAGGPLGILGTLGGAVATKGIRSPGVKRAASQALQGVPATPALSPQQLPGLLRGLIPSATDQP